MAMVLQQTSTFYDGRKPKKLYAVIMLNSITQQYDIADWIDDKSKATGSANYPGLLEWMKTQVELLNACPRLENEAGRFYALRYRCPRGQEETMNDDHEQIRARGKALCLSDEAIDARIAAVVVGYPISAETREIWAARTEGARCVYSAEHAAGLFCPRVKKTLARWASGKGNLPTPMEIQFLAAIAAYDEVAR